jgi:hypothetical protein
MGMNENNVSVALARKTIEGIRFDYQREKMISRATDDYTILSINRIAWMETHNSVSKEDLVKCLRWMCNNTCKKPAGNSGQKAFIELGAVIEYLQEKTGESFCVPATLRSAALIFDFDTKLMEVAIDDTVDRRKAESEGKE